MVDLKSRGLKLEKLTVRHVDLFMMDISTETAKEFEFVYELEPYNAFLDLVGFDGQYAITKDGHVLGLSGVWEEEEGGLMWAVFTNEMKRNFVKFARASKDLRDFYLSKYDQVFCAVWSESHMIMQWLAFLGFTPCDQHWQNGQTLIRFCCKRDKSDLPSGQRPVIH